MVESQSVNVTPAARSDARAAFSLSDARTVLSSTPSVIRALLEPLPLQLLDVNEGDGTWSAFQVLAHLTWGEVDDWIPRARRILEKGTSEPFAPFDREAGFTRYAGWTRDQLLDEFARCRRASLVALDDMDLRPEHLARQGTHPALGVVTLEQLLATWVTHDLAHLAQIARVLTRHSGQYAGPWRAFFSLLAPPATPSS